MVNTKEELRESENLQIGDEESATSLLHGAGELLDQFNCSWTCLQEYLTAHSGRDDSVEQNKTSYFCLC